MLLTRGWYAGIKQLHLPSADNVDPVLRAAGLFPGGVLAALATSEVKSGFAHTLVRRASGIRAPSYYASWFSMGRLSQLASSTFFHDSARLLVPGALYPNIPEG